MQVSFLIFLVCFYVNSLAMLGIQTFLICNTPLFQLLKGQFGTMHPPFRISNSNPNDKKNQMKIKLLPPPQPSIHPNHPKSSTTPASTRTDTRSHFPRHGPTSSTAHPRITTPLPETGAPTFHLTTQQQQKKDLQKNKIVETIFPLFGFPIPS